MTKSPEPKWRILVPTDFSRLEARAAELLGDFRRGDSDASALFREFHPAPPSPSASRLADAEIALARAHDFPTWRAFEMGVRMFNAIADDDPDAVLSLAKANPELLNDRVNGVTSNWGPPLACAVQLGSERVFEALVDLSNPELQWALDRAILKGRLRMARALLAKGATPEPGAAMGPCESLNVEGLRFLAGIGAPLTDESGNPMAPIGMLLEGYARNPATKHDCLALFAERGIDFPDTPMVAFHLGRIDLLEAHFESDSRLLDRRFHYREIYPLELGCHEDESLGLHGTPIEGTTLLHMAIDFDEVEIFEWLLSSGADVNARGIEDHHGFGGQTPLFHTVVSQAARSGRQRDAKMADTLLDRGADPNARASIRKRIRFIADESIHEYEKVTPIAYGESFHARQWVNERALRRIAERGGTRTP